MGDVEQHYCLQIYYYVTYENNDDDDDDDVYYDLLNDAHNSDFYSYELQSFWIDY